MKNTANATQPNVSITSVTIQAHSIEPGEHPNEWYINVETKSITEQDWDVIRRLFPNTEMQIHKALQTEALLSTIVIR